MKKVDLQKLLEVNTNVDVAQVKEAFKALKELRNAGVVGDGYNLMPPFTRRRVGQHEADEHPRSFRLKQ